MKFIVNKLTRKEEAALVEAATEIEAIEIFTNSYNFEETKNSEITKITVSTVPPEAEKTAEAEAVQ